MQEQRPYPGFPSYLNGEGGRWFRRPIYIGAISFAAVAIIAAAVYFVAFANASEGPNAPTPAEETPLAAALPSPTATPEPTTTPTPTPGPSPTATPQPLISPPLPYPTATARPIPVDDRIIVFTLADMPDFFFDLSDQHSPLPGWDSPFVFGTQTPPTRWPRTPGA